MATVLEILASGPIVTVDLLTAIPESNDPTTWQRPNWERYQPCQARAVVTWTQQGQTGKILALFDVSFADPSQAIAFGVTLNGQCLLTGPFQFRPGQTGSLWFAEIVWAITPSF